MLTEAGNLIVADLLRGRYAGAGARADGDPAAPGHGGVSDHGPTRAADTAGAR